MIRMPPRRKMPKRGSEKPTYRVLVRDRGGFRDRGNDPIPRSDPRYGKPRKPF